MAVDAFDDFDVLDVMHLMCLMCFRRVSFAFFAVALFISVLFEFDVFVWFGSSEWSK